jgi:co-chaperonin GroES (HSP10)
MKARPTKGNVIIEAKKKTIAGGLIIETADHKKSLFTEYYVRAVAKDDEVDFKVDDRVLIGEGYKAYEVEDDKKQYICIDKNAIIAVV